MAAPIGKGLFLRTLSNLDDFGDLLRWAGCTWVAVFGDASGGESAFRILPSQIKTLRSCGIAVHVCVYNTHGNLELAKRAYDRVMAHGGSGIVIDAEGDFHDARKAAQLVRAARTFGGTLGFLGLAPKPQQEAWRILVEGTDWSGPQTYDRDHRWGPATVLRLIEGYRAAGAAAVVAGFGAYRCRFEDGSRSCRYTKSPDELREHLGELPPVRAAIGWTLPSFQNDPERYAEQWRILADWDPLRAPWPVNVIPGGRWALAQMVS